MNAGVYKIESKPCSMFKVVQQLEFIDLFFPCCRFSPLPSATPKLMQASGLLPHVNVSNSPPSASICTDPSEPENEPRP